MNDLDQLAKTHRAIIPTNGTTAHRLLSALIKGQRLSEFTCFLKYQTTSGGRRLRELNAPKCDGGYGWPLKKEMIKRNGRRYVEYYLQA